MSIPCQSEHPVPVPATAEITLYERTPVLRAAWRGFCCAACMETGLALLKRRSPAQCLLLVLAVRE